MYRVKQALATLAALGVLAVPAPAQASIPAPWCGTAPSPTDRLPDATPAFALHVAYVRAPGAPDRFGEWAPRIVGDAAAVDAWWRSQDPTRALRFDLFPGAGCTSAFGLLDITSVELREGLGPINGAFRTLRTLLASEHGFRASEKAYLVYFDGSTGQLGDARVCGQGGGGGFGLPGLAVVYLDSCSASTGDSTRPIVAVHELAHVLGAVEDEAPNACSDGHVCDAADDLMADSLTGNELEAHVLDAGRNDYYGHSGRWTDVRSSLFLERLDSPDRTPPASPGALRAGDGESGLVRVSWSAAADDVGPVAYRVYQDDAFLRQVTSTEIQLPARSGVTGYGVRAVDAVGRLSGLASIRFRGGAGMVDAGGRLVRDTVRPPKVTSVSVRRTGATVRISWQAVRDAGGLRGYRVRVGSRSLVVRKPAVALAVARLTGAVSIAAVDRAGNVGPAFAVPRSRLR